MVDGAVSDAGRSQISVEEPNLRELGMSQNPSGPLEVVELWISLLQKGVVELWIAGVVVFPVWELWIAELWSHGLKAV